MQGSQCQPDISAVMIAAMPPMPRTDTTVRNRVVRGGCSVVATLCVGPTKGVPSGASGITDPP
jgi:hypothetical protein